MESKNAEMEGVGRMISAVCLARSCNAPCCAVGPWPGQWQERGGEAEIGGEDVNL